LGTTKEQLWTFSKEELNFSRARAVMPGENRAELSSRLNLKVHATDADVCARGNIGCRNGSEAEQNGIPWMNGLVYTRLDTHRRWL
jgi:hypothetical protein